MDMGGCYICQNIEFIDLSIKDVAPTYKCGQATDGAPTANREISSRLDQAFKI
jgi:hypothetical protein